MTPTSAPRTAAPAYVAPAVVTRTPVVAELLASSKPPPG